MGGPYLNSLIPIVGGVAASAWAPMSSVITPTATNAPLDHAGALVSSFMVLSLASSRIRTLHHGRRSNWSTQGLEGTNRSLGRYGGWKACNAAQHARESLPAPASRPQGIEAALKSRLSRARGAFRPKVKDYAR